MDAIQMLRARLTLPLLKRISGRANPVDRERQGPIKTLCEALVLHGFPVHPNHIYNVEIQRAVVAFQKAKKLTADGIVGPETWAALMRNPVPDIPPPAPRIMYKERLIAELNDVHRLAKHRRNGRHFTGGGNACAATQSYLYIAVGLRQTVEAWAQTFVDEMVGKGLFKEILKPRDIKRGDLIECMDLNGNQASDHVWTAVSDAYANEGAVYALCFDNGPLNSDDIIYERNLTPGRGGRTPMRRAWRLKA